MNDHAVKIYCAGPLFNEPEKKEMKEIASVLRARGFDVFLPHEDGIELAAYDIWLNDQNKHLDGDTINKGIFALDSYMVSEWCDALIVNLNGRVADEGAIVEAAIAWSRNKPVIAYKADSRVLLKSGDNPLVVGLSNFQIIDNINAIPDAIQSVLTQNPSPQKQTEAGRKLFECVSQKGDSDVRFKKLESLLKELCSD